MCKSSITRTLRLSVDVTFCFVVIFIVVVFIRSGMRTGFLRV